MQGDEARSSEMLASLLGPWEMPIDLQLFMATSMLESLVRSKSEKLYSNDELNSLINPMLAVADEKIRDRARELLRSLQRPPYRMLLNLAFKESETWGTEIVPNQNEFIKKQGKLRNAGAHALGNGGEYDIMVDHYYAQILIAYVIIMKRLGLDDALEQFEESSFLEAPRQQIRERYAIAKTKDTTDTA
ncbi:unnamed protein product [Cylicostephanus goldi]|uniref:Apea-like HEPN domain-containing protein n=1 Tax=Cylicostephanus goldi TaxID=71465 RepID=A0A3P6S2H5_CYLGO|nr:unnamed protein product [Cylicostephanus goldi]